VTKPRKKLYRVSICFDDYGDSIHYMRLVWSETPVKAAHLFFADIMNDHQPMELVEIPDAHPRDFSRDVCDVVCCTEMPLALGTGPTVLNPQYLPMWLASVNQKLAA